MTDSPSRPDEMMTAEVSPNPGNTLPAPRRVRWQPTRSGLVNLFKYANEEFRFEEGRLLLRGNNGAGKSRVLALQLPFLLDGELSPHRVEPDRDPAKKMEWNLLMNRHDDRLGYTWIEFARRDEDGRAHYLTLGCGMHARKGVGIPPQSRWFFITSKRVGDDLHLLNEKQVPLTRSHLEAELGDSGTVYRNAKDYRKGVDEQLFRLGPRYRALIELLIRLRQPQLLRELDIHWLSGVLSEALPPVSQTLIDDVAASFRGIEDDRYNMDEFRLARDNVSEFRKTYRHYARIVVRKVSNEVRQSHSAYNQKSREIRQLETAHVEGKAKRDQIHDRLGTAKDDLQKSRASEQTLRESPEMKSAAELERALEARDERRREFDRTQTELSRAETAQTTAKKDRDRARDSLAERRRDAASQFEKVEAVATEADLSWECSIDQWESPAEMVRARQQLESRLSQRNAGIKKLEERNAELAQVRETERVAQREEERCRQDLRAAEEGRDQSFKRRQQTLDRTLQDIYAWEKNLCELPWESRENWKELIEDWLETRSEPFPLEAAVAAAHRTLQSELLRDRERLARDREQQESQIQEVQSDLETLRSGRTPEPSSPHTRSDGARDARAGAPLWRLCGFQDTISPEHRQGYEAALESAGLLDAWLDPDGVLRDPDTHDVVLLPVDHAGLRDSDGLNAILTVESEEVDATTVRRVLAAIETGEGKGNTWVAHDGRWENGPLRGSWQKPEVEYLGATAREANRLRRIAVLEDQLKVMEVTLSEIQTADHKVTARLEQLAEDVRQAPTKDTLVEAALALEHGIRVTDDKRDKLEEATRHLRKAVEASQAALTRRDRDAEDLGLRAWREPNALSKLKDLLASVRELAAGAWPRQQASFDAAQILAASEAKLAEAIETRARFRSIFDTARARANEAEAHYDTLNATVGVAAQEVLRRLEATQAKIRQLEASAEALREEDIEISTQLRVNEREREIASEALQERLELRATSVASLNVLIEHRIFEEAEPNLQPSETQLKTSPAVELARRTEQQFDDAPLDDESLRRSQTRIQAEFTTLNDQLGMRGHHPVIEAIDAGAGAFKVTCPFQGKERTMHELHDLLQDEVTQRERMLDAKEREVIENHLIGEVATELQQRIREGDSWRSGVNQELDRRPTSSGIKLRFAWNTDPDGPAGLSQARRQLLRTTSAWSVDERKAIGDFLHERIRSEQARNEGGSWQEHLTAALDYRAWHRFEVERYQEGQWRRLTKRTYGTSSGGEKALTLTVPQFAAAAAHYQSASSIAPRLILLDEVFVGIDGPTRARLMGLLHSFDLDFVMTSEREWGCYPTLPSLAIYQLASRLEISAVHVTRWVWNGRDRVQDNS